MLQVSPAHIIVGLSGGVDSAVAALLLKKAGHFVEAIFMKNWEEDDTLEFCPAALDFKDAQKVCEKLNIPLHFVNFATEYWQNVFTYFLDEYQAGRTPNPDILCNKEIKFRAFLDYAKKRGADYIATGHYARRKNTHLLKAYDETKDQSYFLHALDEKQLSQSLFPLGELTKTTVRAIAKEAGLSNFSKKDSTGICFIGERKFKQFLNEYLPTKPGNILTLENETIGRHDGLMFYTIGQRQGLQIGGKSNKLAQPWYVIKKDIKQNILYVAQGTHHPALYQQKLLANDVHWINGKPTCNKLQAKTRYRQSDQLCTVTLLEHNQVDVRFDKPQRAITPGQSIVFYKNDVCLGGGIIET